MGLTISSLLTRLFGKKQMRILMGKYFFQRPFPHGTTSLPANYDICNSAIHLDIRYFKVVVDVMIPK